MDHLGFFGVYTSWWFFTNPLGKMSIYGKLVGKYTRQPWIIWVFLEYILVGGFSPTHLEKCASSNWIISPNFQGEDSNNIGVVPPSNLVI